MVAPHGRQPATERCRGPNPREPHVRSPSFGSCPGFASPRCRAREVGSGRCLWLRQSPASDRVSGLASLRFGLARPGSGPCPIAARAHFSVPVTSTSTTRGCDSKSPQVDRSVAAWGTPGSILPAETDSFGCGGVGCGQLARFREAGTHRGSASVGAASVYQAGGQCGGGRGSGVVGDSGQ